MNPRYPVYVISKGRWESRLTVKALEKRNIPFHVVIEPQEFDRYSSVIDKDKILVLPFSNLGQGSIPARNWVWEHSLKLGAKRHWILDDNIKDFFRFNNNKFYKTTSGTTFRIIEDFVDRYKNIAISGMQYMMFVRRKAKEPIMIKNTRIYSCILISNDLSFRWRGRYNEDTDLSLRVLKKGLCTVLFKIYPCEKMTTLTMRGGNTDELYIQNEKVDGRYLMAKSLKEQHPDVVRIGRRWGRWQHVVNYKPFRNNVLIPRKDIKITPGINNYGMILQDGKNEKTTAPKNSRRPNV